MSKKSERLAHLTHEFIRANRLHRACCEKFTVGLSMHRGQHMILMKLAEGNDKTSQTDIAKRLEISPAAVAVMIKKLEKGGYISKKSSDDDNRLNEISITDKGKETVAITQKYFSDVDKTLFSGIDEENLCVLEECFSKMSENMTEMLKRRNNL